MFYHMLLECDLKVYPTYFGGCLHKQLREKLFAEVEGTCKENYGFIISITDIVYIGPGELEQDHISYNVTYKAIVLRPCKGEVLDAVISKIHREGMFVEVGPINCFISHKLIPTMKHCPYDNPPCYKLSDYGDVLRAGDKIRIKIIGVKIDSSGIFAIGTLMDDYLGEI